MELLTVGLILLFLWSLWATWRGISTANTVTQNARGLRPWIENIELYIKLSRLDFDDIDDRLSRLELEHRGDR